MNQALDTAARHPRRLNTVLLAGLLALVAAVVWWSLTAAVVLACLLVAYIAGAGWWLQVARLREQVRQCDYDLAAARSELRALRQGDPSAPTAQLRPIGDRGEIT
ncbi:hypothetical protein AB0K34_13560 [Actinomadura sp. NPDC049382]|uniref:hypothetical protein n=1 Tax=Actinomadura sp. NPDC049382 TaxID=3158220 RepID=UPI00342FF6D8